MVKIKNLEIMNGRKPMKALIRKLRQEKQVLKKTLKITKATNKVTVEKLKAVHVDATRIQLNQIQTLQEELSATYRALAHARKKKWYQFRMIEA